MKGGRVTINPLAVFFRFFQIRRSRLGKRDYLCWLWVVFGRRLLLRNNSGAFALYGGCKPWSKVNMNVFEVIKGGPLTVLFDELVKSVVVASEAVIGSEIDAYDVDATG